jgi:phage-related protein|tara:strand:- start:240 stop:608 length:369 start_codon:yes stop_codon:yes gene_type:complete
MATFPDVLPTYSTVENTKQNSQRIKFADGYEQRLVMGLPTNKRLISLTLTFNVTTAVSKTINDFLNERFDDQASFDISTSFRQNVLPDLTSSPEFICTQRSRTLVTNGRVIMNLVFDEVKEP